MYLLMECEGQVGLLQKIEGAPLGIYRSLSGALRIFDKSKISMKTLHDDFFYEEVYYIEENKLSFLIIKMKVE